MKGILLTLTVSVLLSVPAFAENYMVFPPGGDPYFWSVTPAPNGATVYQWGGQQPSTLYQITPKFDGSATLHNLSKGGFTNIYPSTPSWGSDAYDERLLEEMILSDPFADDVYDRMLMNELLRY